MRFLLLLAAFAGLLGLSGCQIVTPKTADLRQVHELYTQDFAVLNGPTVESRMDAGKPAEGAAFARSLSAINNYRLRYPDDAQELAHLQVLEGMIYLQSGRFGLAAAVKPAVEAAGEKLAAGTGRTVRDRLFAQNFGALLTGWNETRKPNNAAWETFAQAAEKLQASLTALPVAQRAAADEDQGALYLATSAAIFYVWAGERYAEQFGEEAAKPKTADWYAKARDLIGGFLTEPERQADLSGDFGASVTLGRLRYVQWYHWLKQRA